MSLVERTRVPCQGQLILELTETVTVRPARAPLVASASVTCSVSRPDRRCRPEMLTATVISPRLDRLQRRCCASALASTDWSRRMILARFRDRYELVGRRHDPAVIDLAAQGFKPARETGWDLAPEHPQLLIHLRPRAALGHVREAVGARDVQDMKSQLSRTQRHLNREALLIESLAQRHETVERRDLARD